MSAPEEQQQQNPVTASTATEETAAVPATPTKEGTKLYVGNIEYRTTKPEIEELFKDYNITKIEIPTSKPKFRDGKRISGPRSKGYAFVTFQGHDDELDDIIEKFTDAEFKDRKIYVRYLKSTSKKENEEGDAAESKEENKSEKKATAAAKKLTKAKKAPKVKIPFDQGEKSKDTLYLKNLEFSLKADDVQAFFEAEGEVPLWVSVPFLRLPGYVLKKLEAQNKSLERRNKGYAFVKLELKDGETIEDKVAKFNGKLLKDREILTSIAVDVRTPKAEEEVESKPTESEAAPVPPPSANTTSQSNADAE